MKNTTFSSKDNKVFFQAWGMEDGGEVWKMSLKLH